MVRASAQETGKQLAAAALASALVLGTGVEAAKADIAGLTPCSESKAYQKRLKNEVKGLNKRLKQVGRGSAAWILRSGAPLCPFACQGMD